MELDINKIHEKMINLKKGNFELIYDDIRGTYGSIKKINNPMQYFFEKIGGIEYCLYAEFLSFYFNHE